MARPRRRTPGVGIVGILRGKTDDVRGAARAGRYHPQEAPPDRLPPVTRFQCQIFMGQFSKYIANPLVLILIITAGGLTLAGKFWAQYRQSLHADPAFLLRAEHVQLTDLPPWLPPPARGQLLADLNLSQRSLLDPDLVPSTVAALQQHPWVEHVVSVRKSLQGLQAEVRYRRPLLVEMPDRQVMAIDTTGRILADQGLDRHGARQLLRIAVQDLVKQPLQAGAPWPDLRVLAAAELAAELHPLQETAGLAGIYARGGHPEPPGVNPPATANTGPIEFFLWTAGRNEIIWGSRPGQELEGEANAATKQQALNRFVQEHGPLDRYPQLPQSRGNVFDLRSGQVVLLQHAPQAAQSADWLR